MIDHVPRPGPGNSRRRKLVLGLAAVLSLAAIIYVLVRPKESPLDRFRREVRAAVPVGAGREEAVAWAREMGTEFPERTTDPNQLSAGPTIPEVAGVARTDLGSYIEATIPWGRYRVNGEDAPNQLWVFIPLDEAGRVKGHYFYTLADLAEYERKRDVGRKGQ